MNCTTFAAQVHELVDGRLDQTDAEQLHRHADGCEDCAVLLAADRWLVDAVAGLEPPPEPSSRLAERISQSIDGLAALERREQVLPALRVGGEHPWLRWAARAVILLLALCVGVVIGRRGAQPPSAPLAAEKKQGPRPTETAQARPEPAEREPLPNTWRPVSEQASRLARHMDLAAGLYRRAINLRDAKLARPILAYDLQRSGLKYRTPEVRQVLRDPQLAQPAAAYLTQAERLVGRLDSWVHTRQGSLEQIQAELKQAQLLEQIARLRTRVNTLIRLPEGNVTALRVSPAVKLYIKGLDFYYRGQPARMLVQMKRLEKQYPKHALHRLDWEDHQVEVRMYKELDHQVDKQIRIIRRAHGAGHLVVDGRHHPLRHPRPTVLAFYALWGAGQRKRLAHAATIYTSRENQHGHRHISVAFKRAAGQDGELVALYRGLQRQGGVQPAEGFPRMLELLARESDCPGHLTPEEKK